MMNLTVISQILWTSLATSRYFVLFAVAFALVLKVNKVFNFAQAGMMTCGFYAAYVVVRVLGLPSYLGIAAAIAGGVGMAFLLERFGFSVLRQRKASPMFVFIFTLVASQFVTYAMTMVFGTWPTTIFASMFWPVTIVANVAVSAWDLPAIGATLAVLGALWAFLRYTRYGQFMIAVADNADLAELYGIQQEPSAHGVDVVGGSHCWHWHVSLWHASTGSARSRNRTDAVCRISHHSRRHRQYLGSGPCSRHSGRRPERVHPLHSVSLARLPAIRFPVSRNRSVSKRLSPSGPQPPSET